jgi:hypothetical protein
MTQLNQQGIDCCASNKWLNDGQLYPETEGFMMAIQDQVIGTKNYRNFILKDSSLTNDLCRRCNVFPEKIQHITSACGILAPIEYKHRHDSVAKIIHQELGKNMGFVQMLFRITNINHQRFWIIKFSLCTGTEQYTPLEPYQTTDPISR